MKKYIIIFEHDTNVEDCKEFMKLFEELIKSEKRRNIATNYVKEIITIN